MKRTASMMSLFIAALLLVTGALIAQDNPVAAQGGEAKPEKIDPALLDLVEDYLIYLDEDDPSGETFDAGDGFLPVVNGMVVIDTVAAGDPNGLLEDLIDLGLENGAVYQRVVSGVLPISAISQLSELSNLHFASASYVRTASGSALSQGDGVIKSDLVRTFFGVDGSGVTVAAISDSFDCLDGADSDIASGDLPDAGVVVVEELFHCVGPDADVVPSDEGRALLQIVHDVVPGAALMFHSGFNGLANFAQAIERLGGCPPGSHVGCAPAGGPADVIVDDVIYLREPMFQDGIIAQAIDRGALPDSVEQAF